MNQSIDSSDPFQLIILPDGRMDSKNAALYLGLKHKTLAMMRCDGSGPRFIKIGRIFYFKEDLDAWINGAERCQSTAQARFQQAKDGKAG